MMKKHCGALIGLFALFLPMEAAFASDANTTYIQRSIDGYILPSFERFAKETSALPEATQALCTNATEDTRAQFTDTFSNVVEAFGAVNFLRFGPLIDEHRLDAIAFLPDPRGITQRQMRRAIAKKDPTLTTASELREKSVALQGLTALELVAFNSNMQLTLGEPSENHDLNCAYATAIAENAASISAQVLADWQNKDGFQKLLLTAGPDNPRFRTPKEAIETIFNSLVTGLIIVKDQDLLPALGQNGKKNKPHRMPFSRSANSRKYISAELGGIGRAIAAAGYENGLSEEFTWIPGSVVFEIAQGQNYLADINGPVRQELSHPEAAGKINTLIIAVDSLRDTVALEFAGALGFSGGFNALDGD